jgi:hypothetical protein
LKNSIQNGKQTSNTDKNPRCEIEQNEVKANTGKKSQMVQQVQKKNKHRVQSPI